MAKQNKTSETSKTKQVKLKKTKVAQQLYEIKKLSSGAETSLRPCGWNCSLEELLLGVEQDVLLASDNGDALPAQPGDGVGGGGSHTHGEGDLLRVVVQLTVSPHCIGLYFSPPVISVVNSSCIS